MVTGLEGGGNAAWRARAPVPDKANGFASVGGLPRSIPGMATYAFPDHRRAATSGQARLTAQFENKLWVFSFVFCVFAVGPRHLPALEQEGVRRARWAARKGGHGTTGGAHDSVRRRRARGSVGRFASAITICCRQSSAFHDVASSSRACFAITPGRAGSVIALFTVGDSSIWRAAPSRGRGLGATGVSMARMGHARLAVNPLAIVGAKENTGGGV